VFTETPYSSGELAVEDLANIEAPLSLDDRRRVRRHLDALMREAMQETASERQLAAQQRDVELFGSRPARRAARQHRRSVALRVLSGRDTTPRTARTSSFDGEAA